MYATVDIVTFTDADWVGTFQWQCGTDPVTSFPIYFDLTDCKLMMMVRKQPDDVEVFLNLDTDNGGILIEATVDGIFDVVIARDELAEMPPGDYVHSLLVEHSNGYREDVWRGALTHAAGPTR